MSAKPSDIRISIVCPWFYWGDAVGRSAYDYYRVLRHLGFTKIRGLGVRNDFNEMEFDHCAGLDDLKNNKWFRSSDICIYHFAIYHEYFNIFRDDLKTGKHVICFHNVTPKHLMPISAGDIIDRSFDQMALFSGADAIWADSRENIEELQRRGINHPQTTEIPIAVDRPELMTFLEKRTAPVELVYVGRFFPSKGVLDLVDAVARVRVFTSKRFLLRLVGNTDFSDKDYIEQVCSRIRHHGLGEYVDFIGKVDEATLFRIYRRAHIFALASYHEGFCVPVIESLRAGMIPVTYMAGNLRWIAGGRGRTVETGNIDALADAMAGLVSSMGKSLRGPDEPLLQLDGGLKSATEFASEARQYAISFEFEEFSRKVDRALRELIQHGSGRDVRSRPEQASQQMSSC